MKKKKLEQLNLILQKAESTSDLYKILQFLDEEGFSSKMFVERITDYRDNFSDEEFKILRNLSNYYESFSWFIEGGREILNSTEEDISEDKLRDFSVKILDIELLNSNNILTEEEQRKFQKLKELYAKVYNIHQQKLQEEKQKLQEEKHNANFIFLKEVLDFSKTSKSDEELIEFIREKIKLKSSFDLAELYQMLKECKNEFTSDEMQDLLYDVLYTCERYFDYKRPLVKTLLSFDNKEDAVNYIFNGDKYNVFVESYKKINLRFLSEKEIKKLKDIKSLSEKVVSKLKSKENLIQIVEMTKSENYMFSKLIRHMLRMGLKPNLLEESITYHKHDLSNEQILILNNICRDYKRFSIYKGYYFKAVLDMKKNNYTNGIIANYLVDNNFSYVNFKRNLHELYPKNITEEEMKILLKFSEYYGSKYDSLHERKKIEAKREKLNNEIEKAKNVVSEYILLKGKKNDNFAHYLKILKDIDDPLYAEYKFVAKSNTDQSYAKIIKNGKNIVNLIVNGIQLENGNTRKFDVVDYLSRTTLKTDEFLKILKGNLSSQEYNVFRRFVNASKFIPIDTDKLYNSFHACNVQFDKFNNIIPGTGRVIEQHEKENIINYIKKHHLPFTENVYNALFYRWKNGYLQMPTKFNQDNNYLDSEGNNNIKPTDIDSFSEPDDGGLGSM